MRDQCLEVHCSRRFKYPAVQTSSYLIEKSNSSGVEKTSVLNSILSRKSMSIIPLEKSRLRQCDLPYDPFAVLAFTASNLFLVVSYGLFSGCKKGLIDIQA